MQHNIVRIEGVQWSNRNDIFVNGTKLNPEFSQQLYNHSPDGFAWGYQGSGPAQTALAICLHLLKDGDAALSVYQAFKREIVGRWVRDEDFTEEVDFGEFIRTHRPEGWLPAADQGDGETPEAAC